MTLRLGDMNGVQAGQTITVRQLLATVTAAGGVTQTMVVSEHDGSHYVNDDSL